VSWEQLTLVAASRVLILLPKVLRVCPQPLPDLVDGRLGAALLIQLCREKVGWGRREARCCHGGRLLCILTAGTAQPAVAAALLPLSRSAAAAAWAAVRAAGARARHEHRKGALRRPCCCTPGAT
jgi:hypothetical protein